MENSQYYIHGEEARAAHNYHPLPVVITKGEGVWLWDVEGNAYMDLMSGYSAVSHGHRHPKIVAAVQSQLEKVCVTSRAFHTDQLYPFLDKLCRMSKMDMALPMNTGAEAVETAVKAARRWGYRVKGIRADQAEVIVAKDNFHGRTITITSFSTDPDYRDGFGPMTPGFVTIPFGDLEALKKAITPRTCAVLFEPIQGESGIQIPPSGWLAGVQKLCHDNNVLFILDEIQSGLGRTGKLFAYQHEHVQPDGLILGKALGGGILPVSCFLAKRELMDVFTPGSHGSTFGGNPLAAHVALTALEVLEDEKLVQRSQELGDYFLKKLKTFNSPIIKALRGRGLWIGIEIDTNRISARKVCEVLMKHGILTKEAHDTVIRIAPPLVITQEQCDWALERIEKALKICL